MADERNDDATPAGEEFRALADVRAALEVVEREQGHVVRQLRRVLDQRQDLLSALGGSGFVLSFDEQGMLMGVAGAVDRFFGISAGDVVSGFDDFAPPATKEMLGENNRKVLDADVDVAEGDGALRREGTDRVFHWIHTPRVDAAGDIVGVDAIGLPEAEISEAAGGFEASDPFEGLFVETAQRIVDDPSGASIERALSMFGEAFGVDRVVVSGYEEDDRRFSVRSSWLRAGTEPLSAETRGISISEIPWAYSRLAAGETVLVSESLDISEDAAAEKRLYATEGSKTSLLVPVVRNDVLSGFVSFQSVAAERDWSNVQLAEARRCGMLLSSALAQAAQLADLESARSEAREAIARVEEAERRADRADARAQERDQRIAEVSEEAEKLRARAADLEDEIETAKGEADDARELSGAADKRVREAEEAADDARSELDGAKQEAIELRRELAELGAEAERAQRRSEDTAADALIARKECEEARAEADEARRGAADARARLQAMIDEARGEVSTGAPDAEALSDELPRGEPSGTDVEAEGEIEAESEPDVGAQDLVPYSREVAVSVESGVVDFDPDATVELSTENFDLDATLEIEPSEASVEAEADVQGDSDGSGEISEVKTTQAPDPERQVDDSQRVSGLNGILETTQAVERSASDAEDATSDAEAENRESAEVARDVEAAQRMARQVAGKGGDEPVVAQRPEQREYAFGLADEIEASTAGAVDGEPPTPNELLAPQEPVAPHAPPAPQEPSQQEPPPYQPPTFEQPGLVDGERDIVVEPAWQADAADATVDAAISDLDTAPPAASPVPGLPGIDSTIGLQDVGGNVELYRNLLSKFRQDYVGAAAKIESAIAKGNIEIAHLLLHAIKGVAGMLGAQRVRSTAEELEISLIGGDESANQAALEAFIGALDEALESIAALDEGLELPSSKPKEVPAADTHVSDPMVLRSYLSGLRQHLLAEKPKQCDLVMREITARTWPGELNEQVTRLAGLVNTQQFTAARQTFDALMSTFEED